MCSKILSATFMLLLSLLGLTYAFVTSETDQKFYGKSTITAVKCTDEIVNGRLATHAYLWVEFYWQGQRYKTSLPKIVRSDTPECPYTVGNSIDITVHFHGGKLTYASHGDVVASYRSCEADEGLQLMFLGGVIAALGCIVSQKEFWDDCLGKNKKQQTE